MRPIRITAPGGVPFALNSASSEETFVAETIIISTAPACLSLAALRPPPLSARLAGVRKYLAPPRPRGVALAKRTIRRNLFEKVRTMRGDGKASIIKLEINEFGQDKAAALDVWPVMDVSNMDLGELSYQWVDGIESIEDTIGEQPRSLSIPQYSDRAAPCDISSMIWSNTPLPDELLDR